jgi:hypothetical protein
MNDTADTLRRCHALALAAMANAAKAAHGPAPVGAPLSARERELLAAFGPAALARIERTLMRLRPEVPRPRLAALLAPAGVSGAKPPPRSASTPRRRFVPART